MRCRVLQYCATPGLEHADKSQKRHPPPRSLKARAVLIQTKGKSEFAEGWDGLTQMHPARLSPFV
jgi:hypothetical protein